MEKVTEAKFFGGFTLRYGARVLMEKDYLSPKLWAVLADLILNRHRQVTQSELIEHFWEG